MPSRLNVALSFKFIAMISAISSTDSGWAVNASYRKIVMAYCELSSLIADKIRLYILSSIGGSVTSAFCSAAWVRHFPNVSSWQTAHRNLQLALVIGIYTNIRWCTHISCALFTRVVSISCLTVGSFLHWLKSSSLVSCCCTYFCISLSTRLL